MARRRLQSFKYRMTKTGKAWKTYTFYAHDQPTADGWAKKWAKRVGYKRVVRLKVSA